MQQFLFDRDWQRRFPFLVASVKPKPQASGTTPQPAATSGDNDNRATTNTTTPAERDAR